MDTQQLTFKKCMAPVGIVLVSAILAIGFGVAGNGDYEQAVADQALYCQMVQEQVYPSDPARPCDTESEQHVATL